MFTMPIRVYCDACDADGGVHNVIVDLHSINDGKAAIVARYPEEAKPKGWVLVKKIDSTSCYCYECAVKNGFGGLPG